MTEAFSMSTRRDYKRKAWRVYSASFPDVNFTAEPGRTEKQAVEDYMRHLNDLGLIHFERARFVADEAQQN